MINIGNFRLKIFLNFKSSPNNPPISPLIKEGLFSFLIFIVLIFLLSGCSQNFSEDKQTFTKSTNPEIAQITPKKPTRIELKRTSTGKYSWGLRGDDVEDITRIDKKLREYIENNSKNRPD